MTFKAYQEAAKMTAQYPVIGEGYIYPLVGLAGEVGEVCEIIKKVHRDQNSVISEDTRTKLINELGDVLWYIATLATELEIGLDAVATINISKLFSRMERGVIQGSGSDR